MQQKTTQTSFKLHAVFWTVKRSEERNVHEWEHQNCREHEFSGARCAEEVGPWGHRACPAQDFYAWLLSGLGFLELESGKSEKSFMVGFKKR